MGAGGIGVVLWEMIRGFYFPQTSAVMLVIIAVVVVFDMISQFIRKRFV